MKKHSNMAERFVMIDFDDTIIPWGPLMVPRPPFERVAEAIRETQEDGFSIGILTSRMSPAWVVHAGTTLDEQEQYVRGILDEHGISVTTVTAEKLPAEAYFDDKAIHVPPGTLADRLTNWRKRRG